MNDRNLLRAVVAGLTLVFSMGLSAQDVLTWSTYLLQPS